MDRDTHDLIIQLCTRAGMIMEDASAVTLTVGSIPQVDLGKQLDNLSEAIERCSSLLKSARSLSEP